MHVGFALVRNSDIFKLGSVDTLTGMLICLWDMWMDTEWTYFKDISETY